MTTAPDVQYETRAVKTVRGMESRTKAKIEKEGWEFVSQTQGTLRSELNFRREKPKTPWKLLGIGGGGLALLIIVLLVGNAIRGADGGTAGSDTAPLPTPSQIASSEAATEASSPSAAPEPATVVTELTVDELLAMLNSAEMGGITVGDQFRLTGELFMSEYWMTGASGDFFVMLKAQGGAQDLTVFVDETAAARWQDGTRVEMVVEMVEATINGETTDGWLRAKSVTTIP